MSTTPSRVRISSSALDFQLVRNKSDTIVPTMYHYRKPKLKKGRLWYIEYYYRIPIDVRPLYNKDWLRFRIKEDINRRVGYEKEVYAEWLRGAVEESLKNGFNPFKHVLQKAEQEQKGIEKKELNATDALELFLEEWKLRGLEPESLSKYNKVIGRLIAWLKLKQIPYINVEEITQNHIELFLRDMKKDHGFSNREYNNHFDFTRTAFNYLLKKKYITESPCVGIDKMKAKTSKHRYYDQKSLDDITKAMAISDPYVLLAFQSVYYLCLRSDKEMMHLKVGNIKWEENKVLSFTKGNSERYIPMDEHIKSIWLNHGINNYPRDHYIFGIHGKPDIKPFGKGFFSKRFRKVREAAGLSKDFSLYSAKHTRIIHLKTAGAMDADIMSLTGHKDFTAYAIYLRDLGITADINSLNKASRKI